GEKRGGQGSPQLRPIARHLRRHGNGRRGSVGRNGSGRGGSGCVGGIDVAAAAVTLAVSVTDSGATGRSAGRGTISSCIATSAGARAPGGARRGASAANMPGAVSG